MPSQLFKKATLAVVNSHRLANPALRTAVEIALMAVSRELRSMVREPVAGATFLCSLSTNRVSVMVSTLISSMGKGGADSAIADSERSCNSNDYNAAALSQSGALGDGWITSVKAKVGSLPRGTVRAQLCTLQGL